MKYEIHAEFWRARVKASREDLVSAEAGSIRQMVASVFHQGALHQVRLLEEREKALRFLPWGFYVAQADSLAEMAMAKSKEGGL